MTLVELQKVLGDRIEISLKNDLTPEERQTENEQSALVMNIAKQMINNGDLILRTEKLLAQTKNLKESIAMRLIIGEEKK
jgi:membrane-associated HD superfamily phosphohydrolase